MKIVRAAKGVYREDLVFDVETRPYLRGHWADRLPAIEEDLAKLEDIWKEKGAPSTPRGRGKASASALLATALAAAAAPASRPMPLRFRCRIVCPRGGSGASEWRELVAPVTYATRLVWPLLAPLGQRVEGDFMA